MRLQTQIDKASIKDQTMKDSTNVIPTIHYSDVLIEEFVHTKEVVSKELLKYYNQLFLKLNRNAV